MVCLFGKVNIFVIYILSLSLSLSLSPIGMPHPLFQGISEEIFLRVLTFFMNFVGQIYDNFFESNKKE
jgi:hypothetical protein